ncbi:MAG: TolC family protein [Deltaproteobacteria bacterium]|nr:TolC family protein [Candidatus Anaeroferrophillus wilburensis]MBN2887984.1 TolC family protein [Deltaproteobacteria bacterium]
MKPHWVSVLLIVCLLWPPAIWGQDGEPAGVLTLEQAIDEALANHPLIEAALEMRLEAEAGGKSAAADLLPKISTSYSYNRLHNEPYATFGPGSFIISDDDVFTWDVTAVQPLFTGFALTTRKKIAGLESAGREVERQQVMLEVVQNVKVAYARILLARRQLAVAGQEVENLSAHLRDAGYLYDQGMIAYNDLLQSQVALAQAQQQQVRTRQQLEVAKAALNVLLNRDIGADHAILDLAVEPAVSDQLDQLIAEAVAQRPELRYLEVKAQQAELAVKLARSSYYPTVSLVGRYEQSGHNAAASENDYRNSDTASIGVQADWQLFEWGKRPAEVRRKLHALNALRKNVEEAANRVSLEVKTAYSALQVTVENVKTAEAALEQAREHYRITTLQYQQQVATSTAVLDASTFLSRAENNYYGALYGYLISWAELERAVGRNVDIRVKHSDGEQEEGQHG